MSNIIRFWNTVSVAKLELEDNIIIAYLTRTIDNKVIFCFVHFVTEPNNLNWFSPCMLHYCYVEFFENLGDGNNANF